jgi:hypothetical protein
MKYYVYRISDPTGEHYPYYGKGTENRMFWHWDVFQIKGYHPDNYNLTKMFRHIRSCFLIPEYKKIFETNSEEAAYKCEEFCTEYYGLNNLSNIVHGGIAPPSRLGFLHTEETKHKISRALSGEKSPMYGKKMSEESCRKSSEAHKGHKVTEETKQKISESMKGKRNGLGYRHTVSAKRKISEAKSGEQHHFFGKVRSMETKRKISQTLKKRNKELSKFR